MVFLFSLDERCVYQYTVIFRHLSEFAKNYDSISLKDILQIDGFAALQVEGHTLKKLLIST